MFSPMISTAWHPYAQLRGGYHTVVGDLRVLPQVYSPQLNNRRDLLVYLPAGYASSGRRYPVLYMHDGQNLFDCATGYGGQEWQVDETLAVLEREGVEAIVVGLPHMGEERVAEYNPFPEGKAGRGEQYVAFMVETVKPLIDRDFRTLSDRAHTGVLGSSMGGLISLFAFFRYPAVFGLVASLSPSFWYANGAIYGFVTQAQAGPGRIYLDHGTRENNAGPMYTLLRGKGYSPGQDLQYIAEEGGEHSESAWARRLPGALRFLLGR